MHPIIKGFLRLETTTGGISLVPISAIGIITQQHQNVGTEDSPVWVPQPEGVLLRNVELSQDLVYKNTIQEVIEQLEAQS
jgi:hypothetical protein